MAEAEQLFQRALRIQEAALGAGHEVTRTTAAALQACSAARKPSCTIQSGIVSMGIHIPQSRIKADQNKKIIITIEQTLCERIAPQKAVFLAGMFGSQGPRVRHCM